MSSAVISFPEFLTEACAEIVEFAHLGGEAPTGLTVVQNWLSNEGWQGLADQWHDEVVFRVCVAPFDDEEVRARLDLADDEQISDFDKISFAKQWMEDALDENDSYVFPSLHICEITRADGKSAVIGCTVIGYGQGGLDLTWHGAFTDEEALRSYLSGIGLDIEVDPERIDADYIKRFWSQK